MHKTIFVITALFIVVSIFSSGCALTVVYPPPDNPDAAWLTTQESHDSQAGMAGFALGTMLAPIILLAVPVGIVGNILSKRGSGAAVAFGCFAMPGLILIMVA